MSDELPVNPPHLVWWRVALIIPLSILSVVILAALVTVAIAAALPLTLAGFILLYPLRLALRWLSGPLWGRRWGLL